MAKLFKGALLLIVFALIAAACGDSSTPSAGDGDTSATEATSTEPTSTEPTSTEPTSTEPTSTEPTSTEPTSTDPPVATADPVELVIPASITGNLPYDALNAEFMERFPNVTLVPGGGFWDAHDEPAFLTAAANEQINDVLTGGDEYPDTYGPRGIFLDLRPYLEADADLWYNDDEFTSWWIYENPDGAIYSVPLAGNPLVLWYNPELLEAAGLEPPPSRYDDPAYADWTWDKFTEYVDALSEVATWGTGIENNILIYGSLIASNGGSLINDDASEYLIDDPAVVETLEFMTSFARNGTSPDPSGAQDLGGINSLFQAGEVATWIAGAWNTGGYSDPELDLDFTPAMATLPHNGTTTGFVNCVSARFGISAFYDNPDIAYEYVKFVNFGLWDTDLVGPETDFHPNINVRPRAQAWVDILAASDGNIVAGSYGPDGQDLSYLTTDACSERMMLSNPPWYGPFLEVRDITKGEMDLVFSGQQSVDEAVAAIKEQATNALARFARGN